MKSAFAVFLLPAFLNLAFAQTQTNSIRDSSANAVSDNKKADNTNKIVGALNMGVSGMYFNKCGKRDPNACVQGAIYLMMGLQNMKQAKANGGVAFDAGGTLGMTDIGMGAGAGAGYDRSAVAALAALEKDRDIASGIAFGTSRTNADPATGFAYDPKTNTVTTMDGKKIKGTDLTSPSAMAAAGFSKSMIDSVSEAQKSLEEKANKKMDKYGLNKMVNGEEEGGGGGGGGGSGGSGGRSGEGNTADYQLPKESASKLGIDRDPAQVAGMQKDFNGEPIGVSADSIFRMMTRRYKVKESQSSFLDDSALIQK